MKGRILGNRYEIIEKIGGGGMALVYKAKCQLLNRFVAVKILRPEFTSDEDFISKFKRESQAAASLSHPNIVNIYDVGNEDNDVYYIVMEYVKGKTLKQVIKEKGALEADECINISKQIALALQHAHTNHIVHRDIKPHNILITDDGRVKVTDFGIARAATSSTVTNTGSVIGSVHYFSPEQARGGYTDEKSDLYSLGIVMYEMSVGKVPFEGESPISIALKHIHEDVTPPSVVNHNIPKALEDIIMKLIQKDQIKRYNSAKEILEDLNQALKQPMGNFVKIDEDDDSPTQVIPAIKDEDIKINRNAVKNAGKEKGKVKEKELKNRWVIWGAIATAFILALIFIGSMFYFNGIFAGQEKEVPDVEGIPYEKAKENLENIGLTAEYTEQFSAEFDKGTVMTQEPKKGEIVKAGYPIKLIVSKGAKMVEVPNLVNKNVNEIEAILFNANLKEGAVKYEHDALPIGVVISQNPEAKRQVAEGSEISVLVSKGPETKSILMPNLLEKDLNSAKKMIETSGLIVGNIEYKPHNSIAKDNVISQSIAPETEVEEKRVVDLVVSKGPENVEQPGNSSELKPVDLTIYLSTAKQEEFRLRIVKEQDGSSVEVYNGIENRSKGEKKITIQGRGKATLYIYFDDVMAGKPTQIDFDTGKLIKND